MVQCPICDGKGEVPEEHKTVLNESFEYLQVLIDAISDDKMEITVAEAIKIRKAGLEFVDAYNKAKEKNKKNGTNK